MSLLIPPSGFEFQQAQRVLIDETNNAVHAHGTLYEGNPGQWDPESAWGALQTICAEQAMLYLRKLDGQPPLVVPTCQKYAAKAAKRFIEYCLTFPLVRAGATTNNDAQAFARILVLYVKFLVQGIQHPQPAKLYDRWLKDCGFNA